MQKKKQKFIFNFEIHTKKAKMKKKKAHFFGFFFFFSPVPFLHFKSQNRCKKKDKNAKQGKFFKFQKYICKKARK